MKNKIIAVGIILLFTSCSSKIKTHDYQKSPCSKKINIQNISFGGNIFLECDDDKKI